MEMEWIDMPDRLIGLYVNPLFVQTYDDQDFADFCRDTAIEYVEGLMSDRMWGNS